MPQQLFKPPLRLANPYFKTSNLKKGSYTLDPVVYDYFFAHILAGPIGPAQAMVAIFYRELYKHFTEVLKLPPCYIEDGREIMAEVLSNLNFNPERKLGNPESLPPSSGRRANPRPAKSARKSNPKQQPDTGTASGSGSESA